MTSTYEKIASTTLGSAAADITFSTISGTYTDLVLVLGSLTTASASQRIRMQLNSDTGTTYSNTDLYGEWIVSVPEKERAYIDQCLSVI